MQTHRFTHKCAVNYIYLYTPKHTHTQGHILSLKLLLSPTHTCHSHASARSHADKQTIHCNVGWGVCGWVGVQGVHSWAVQYQIQQIIETVCVCVDTQETLSDVNTQTPTLNRQQRLRTMNAVIAMWIRPESAATGPTQREQGWTNGGLSLRRVKTVPW